MIDQAKVNNLARVIKNYARSNISVENFEMQKQSTADEGYFATYVFKINGTQIGDKINIPFGTGNGTVDNALSESSENPVQNKVIYSEIDDITDAITWILENVEDSNQQLEQEVADLRELVMWIMNQDLDKDLETKIEKFLEGD